MSIKLEDIELEIQNILETDFEDDETYQKSLNYLDDLYKQEKDKVEAIGYVVRKKKSEIDFLKQEEDRIKRKRYALNNKIDNFKEYIKKIMLYYEIKNIKGHTTTIYTVSSESVEITDEEELPTEFVETEIKKKPKKTEIKNALKNGKVVEGAALNSSISLVIR